MPNIDITSPATYLDCGPDTAPSIRSVMGTDPERAWDGPAVAAKLGKDVSSARVNAVLRKAAEDPGSEVVKMGRGKFTLSVAAASAKAKAEAPKQRAAKPAPAPKGKPDAPPREKAATPDRLGKLDWLTEGLRLAR
jgi:ribosomal protein L12E/L44/L45/RPP1/RPP2